MRERVEIQLDHPQIALVEEERIVPLVKGVNQVDFPGPTLASIPTPWCYASLLRRTRGTGCQGAIGQPSAPTKPPWWWSVAASTSGAARMRISYVLGGLSKEFHHRAVADRDEKTLNLAQYLRVGNAANEAYDDARFWAGVGERFEKPLGG